MQARATSRRRTSACARGSSASSRPRRAHPASSSLIPPCWRARSSSRARPARRSRSSCTTSRCTPGGKHLRKVHATAPSMRDSVLKEQPYLHVAVMSLSQRIWIIRMLWACQDQRKGSSGHAMHAPAPAQICECHACVIAGQGRAADGAAAGAHAQPGAPAAGAGRQARPARQMVRHRAVLAVRRLNNDLLPPLHACQVSCRNTRRLNSQLPACRYERTTRGRRREHYQW